MNIRVTFLLASLLCTASTGVIAQSDEAAANSGQELKLPAADDAGTKKTSPTGLNVEERRYENRLDGVSVQRKPGGVKEYYDLNNPDIQRREGGIVEGGAMRTWRLGGQK